MEQLVWDEVGARFFELGCDRGVLFPVNGPGVAWSGLVSVDDKTSTEAPVSYYFDGLKFDMSMTPAEYQATIQAFTYPDEFEICEGTVELDEGILVTQQAQEYFGLSYRTKVGNDVDGVDHAYKIHLVYNALATPSTRNYGTMDNSPTPVTLSWDIDTIPVDIPGARPSAHLILDTRRVDPSIIKAVEDILYGLRGKPRLPTPTEILNLRNSGPLGERFIVVIPRDIPDSTVRLVKGDAVFSQETETVFGVGQPTIADDVREVIVIVDGEDVPDTALPGDLVYNKDTCDLFEVGG